jgi:hypothetical protein
MSARIRLPPVQMGMPDNGHYVNRTSAADLPEFQEKQSQKQRGQVFTLD